MRLRTLSLTWICLLPALVAVAQDGERPNLAIGRVSDARPVIAGEPEPARCRPWRYRLRSHPARHVQRRSECLRLRHQPFRHRVRRTSDGRAANRGAAAVAVAPGSTSTGTRIGPCARAPRREVGRRSLPFRAQDPALQPGAFTNLQNHLESSSGHWHFFDIQTRTGARVVYARGAARPFVRGEIHTTI